MESITRNVDQIESDERRVYETVLGHALRGNQQVILRVIDLKQEPDESVSRAAREEFHELCREGTENRARRGISVEEADAALDEAVRAARSRKTDLWPPEPM
jgi:polyribonucleotide nucleotidyltransferase